MRSYRFCVYLEQSIPFQAMKFADKTKFETMEMAKKPDLVLAIISIFRMLQAYW